MKKLISIAAICCFFSLAAFGQKAVNFAGVWTLDASHSQLGERSRVESITLTVTQSAKDLKVETATTRQAPAADAPQSPNGPGRGFGGMRGFGNNDGTVVYDLEGKESVVEMEGPNGKIPIKYKAAVKDGKAELSSSRSFTGPMGEINITTRETWSLSEDGKTLTVHKEQTTPRGTNSSVLVFLKK